MRVELLPPLGEELFEALFGIGAGREDAADEPASTFVVSAGVSIGHSCGLAEPDAAGGPILSRRVRSDPPARRDFFERARSPAA
jgi:hypothetical protein